MQQNRIETIAEREDLARSAALWISECSDPEVRRLACSFLLSLDDTHLSIFLAFVGVCAESSPMLETFRETMIDAISADRIDECANIRDDIARALEIKARMGQSQAEPAVSFRNADLAASDRLIRSFE